MATGKMMQRLLSLLFIMGLFLVIGPAMSLSFAQEEEVVLEAQEGLTTAELNAINSQGDPKKRANKAMDMATKKMKEARKNARQGNVVATENAVKGFEASLGHAMNSLEEGEEQGADLSNTILKVSDATLKHEESLAKVLDRVPDQAKPHIEHAMEVSRMGHDRALDALEAAAARQENPGQQAETFLKAADRRAAQAQNASARGDDAGAQRAAAGYARALNGSLNAVNRAQNEGQNVESVLSRVANATRKHESALGDAMGRVPEEARASLQRAMEASQKGNQMAVANLERAQQQRMARQGAFGAGGSRGGFGGASAGRSGGARGPGPSVGGGPGGGVGRGAAGGGRPR